MSLYSSVLTDKSKSSGLDKLFIPRLLYPHLSVDNISFIGTNNSLSNKYTCLESDVTSPVYLFLEYDTFFLNSSIKYSLHCKYSFGKLFSSYSYPTIYFNVSLK